MEGDVVRYRFYKNSSNSLITIPRTIANILKWGKNKRIHIEYRTVKGKRGLFMYINEEGQTVTYYAKLSTITIPISVARALGWKDQDDINVIIKEIEEKKGLFLYK